METITLNASGDGSASLPLEAGGRYMFAWHSPTGALSTSAVLSAKLSAGLAADVPLCIDAEGTPVAIDLTTVADGSFEFTAGGTSLEVSIDAAAANDSLTVEVNAVRLAR